MTSSFPLSWEVGWAKSPVEKPSRFVPSTVPGAVQLDWAHAEGWEPYYFGNNWRDYSWMEDVWWTYRTKLRPLKNLAPDERLFFVCLGVDYRFDVRLNGVTLHTQEGMFTPFEIELTCHAREGGTLEIALHPAPKSRPAPDDRSQANRSCKPAMSYGWDFHPRLIPLGIWQEARLEIRPKTTIKQAEVFYELAADFSKADVHLAVGLSGGDHAGRIRWRLIDPAGGVVLEELAAVGGNSVEVRAALRNPGLWWPHDQGKPALYQVEVGLLDEHGKEIDSRKFRVGFRRVRLVMSEGAWDWPSEFPKTRSNPPITLEINGRRIFGKGANWVSPDIFPGTLDRGRYQAQLDLVRGANMNLLRMWGGAPAQKESFYEICDELGILIWQEFPLGCNLYPDEQDYLDILDQESRSLIHRLRGHPCLVIWCGGNELFNAWSGMTDQSLPIRLLNKNCYEMDAVRPFLPTSPVMGMGHGHYIIRDIVKNEECWALFQQADCTAYTEFGCPGPAPLEVLKSIIPAHELFPPLPGTAWETHHAFEAWLPGSHLYSDTIQYYLGPGDTLEALVEKGMLLQSSGYQGLFEEARRQKPRASMALNWCLNEPWPTAANNSLISWPCMPKLALKVVGDSCRPVLASARIPKMRWEPGELLTAEIWMLSDAPEPVAGGRMEVFLKADQNEILLLAWEFPALRENKNCMGPRVQYVLPAWNCDRFKLLLRVDGRPALDSTYVLYFHLPASPANAERATPTMNF